MSWLPHEHDGVRSPHEALRDLRVISFAQHGRDEAHVTVDPDDGEPTTATGHVDLTQADEEHWRLSVAGKAVAEITPRRCRGGWLTSYDGADYYHLRIDLGDLRLRLSDAYNGL